MILPLTYEPHELLHRRLKDVDVKKITTREMQKFFKDMIETMYVKDGVGLAANQVGVDAQIFTLVKNYNHLNDREDLVLINPSWEKVSGHQAWDEEGCLSIPGLYGKIKRYTHIRVKAYNKKGELIEFEAKDFFARIIQHECDHLNGHLYAEKAKDFHREEKTK